MTDWLTATGILLAALVAGFMIIYSIWRKRAPATADDLERRDLESRRDALLRQLRETEPGTEERERLERDAADVLRKLEAKGGGQAPSPVGASKQGGGQAPSPVASTGTLKGFLWGAGSTAALALLAFFVYQSTVERGANDGLTGGGPPQAGGGAPPQASSEVQALEAAVRQNPDDLQARNDLAKAYFDQENLMAVFEQTKYVLERSPNDPRSLTYQALVRTAMGQMDRAREMLEQAVKSDPTFLDAWVSLAWVRTATGRMDEARSAIDEAIKRRPEERERLEQLFAQMKQRASEAPGAAAPAAPPPAAPAPSGPSIAIRLSASRPAPAGAVIFVIARAAGVTAGPPIAVKRVAASAFPMQVSLSSADSMMGQQLPDRVRIEARVDTDGNAMTKTAEDLSAAQDQVALGSSIELTLR